jgi:hypothetical protein
LNLAVELVHDPHRHRTVVGWSADLSLIAATAEHLIWEADRRSAQFEGISDIEAAAAHAESQRLRQILRIVWQPDEEDGATL